MSVGKSAVGNVPRHLPIGKRHIVALVTYVRSVGQQLELVGAAEIAELLGVTRQRVNQIVAEDPTFPEPVAELTAGRIWHRSDVVAWAVASGRGVDDG